MPSPQSRERVASRFRRGRLNRCIAWSAALIFFGATSALRALDPGKSIFQYNCQNWTRLAGLPADKINAIAQTPDGYLWFGSQNGLIRFDGQEFKPIPIDLPAAQGQDVSRLTQSRDGRLWFNIHAGGYGSYDGKKFTALGDPRWTAPGLNAVTLLAARDDSIWTGANSGWGHWIEGNARESVADQTPGPVIALLEDAAGRLWLGTAEKGLFYWEKGELKKFPDDELLTHNIQAIVQDLEGDLWVATERGIYRYDAQFQRKEIFFPTALTAALFVDRHGVLWAAPQGLGLARFQDGKFTLLQKADGLGSDAVTALFEDAEGSLWVGTVEGLSQLTDVKFPIYSFKEGLVVGGSIAVAPSARGGVWVAMASGLSYFDGHSATNYTEPFPNRYIRRVLEAKNGDVYLVDGDRNLLVRRRDGTTARFANTLWPEALAEDATSVLVGIGPELLRFQSGRLQPYRFEGEAPNFNWINHLHVATDGAIWVATNNGLFRVKEGKVKRWSTSEDLSSDRVHFVFEDTDGQIWGGLPTGLIRIKDERVIRITTENGLSDNRIYAIVPDDHGFFWLASGRGILRIARQNLHDFADHKITRIDCETYDGLESVKFNDRTDQAFSGGKTTDGHIWFPNPRGVVMIDPVNYTRNTVAPRVLVERARANGRDLADRHEATLAAAERSAEFFFTALSYVAPRKVRVRYQLEGFDSSWIDAGGRRSVAYNNLRPGSYTFRVQAANADGIWNRAGAEYRIHLPPPFYQRTWFYLVLGGVVPLAAFTAYRWKVRHMQALQKKLTAQNDLLESKVRQRTQELASSLSLLRATLDCTADGILAIQLSDRTVSYNRQFAEMWRIPPAQVGQLTHAELQAVALKQVKDPPQFTLKLAALFTKPETESFDVVELEDGRLFERYTKPQRIDGRSVGVVINYRDITARRRAEQTIAEASAVLDSLLTNTLDMMYFKDLDSRFVRYSENLAARHNLQHRDDLKGKSDFDLFPKAQAQSFFEEEQNIIRTGRPSIDALTKAPRGNGKLAWVLTSKIPWRDQNGKIIGTFGIARDVTALKEAEIGLAYERDLLKALLDNSPDKITFKDRQSRFIKCSQAQAKLFQVNSTEDLIGKTDFDFFTAAHAQPAFDDEQTIMRTGRPLTAKVEKETWRDGRVSWVLTSKIPLSDNTGSITGTVSISKDITSLKEAEAKLEEVHKQLLETSRQAGMAEVATSVLHNVGNVLNSVNVSATLVTEQMRNSKANFVPKIGTMLQAHANDLPAFLATDPKGAKIAEYLVTLGEELLAEQSTMTEELGHLRKNVEHIKEIVSMQQNFAKVSGITEAIPLVEIVDDALRINTSALTRHEVAVVRDYQVQPVVTLERHKLMQILVNLIRNAKYACADGNLPDKKIVVRITQHEQRLRIAVIDDGVGISPENLTRIFAHGFTTRKDGHGFGLHSGALVAKELGGSLTAHSEGLGHGATFTIELPYPTS